MSKKEKFFAFMSNRVTLAVEAAVALFAPVLFYSCRTSAHAFVDIVLFDGFTQIVFWLMILEAGLASVLCAIAWRYEGEWTDKRRRVYDGLATASFAAAAVFLIFGIAMLATMGRESAPMAGRSLVRLLPISLAIWAAVFFALFFPAVKNKKARIAVVASVAGVCLLGLLFAVYPPVHYRFLSAPMVVAVADTEGGVSDEYSVVFATSAPGTGYIEYDYNGEHYKIYDAEGGKIEGGSMIHSITVPREHLDGNSYKVGSMRVFEVYGYGGRNGRTIESETYHFKGVSGEEQTYLCVSDWHVRLARMKETISHAGDYDAVLLMGDAAPALQYEDEAAHYIVKFGGDVSGGEKPVIYLRGNHETRGAYASELPGALGLNEFYGEVRMGDYRIIVLDSGEDKVDSHPEYGSLSDYGAYRVAMVEWLESLENDGSKTIVLSHSPSICLDSEEELRDRAYAAIERIGGSLVISGHLHELYFNNGSEIVNEVYRFTGDDYEDDATYNAYGVPVYVDGGFIHKAGDFVASTVTLNANGIALKAVNLEGEVLLETSLTW